MAIDAAGGTSKKASSLDTGGDCGRHATAARVDVRLGYGPESTVLVVEDHAAPSSPPSAASSLNGGGYGLTGMRERAELLGGELFAAPTPTGFRVELRLPTAA